MQTHIKKLPGSKIELEATVGSGEFDAYVERARDQAINEVHLKGFRPGTAPRELAEQAIDGEKVFDAAANEAVRASMEEAAKENEWIILEKPVIEVIEANPAPAKRAGFLRGEKPGLRYRATFTVFPEISLGNYKKIAHRVCEEREPVTVAGEEVEKTMEWIRQSRAKLTRRERGAELGDLVEADIASTAENKPIPGGGLKGDRFVLGESRFMPGFDEKLLGAKSGELVRFSLTAPAEYWREELRNKQIDFTVAVKGVFEREVPVLDDTFVKGLGPNFASVEALRESIRSGLIAEKQEKERDRLRAKMLTEIVKASAIDIPEMMVEKTLDDVVAEVKQYGGGGGYEYTDKALRDDLRERARERALASLVLYKLEKEGRLEPTPEEIHREAERRNLDPKEHYDYTYGIVRNRKVFEFLEKTT